MSPFLANVTKVAFMRSPDAVSSAKVYELTGDVTFEPAVSPKIEVVSVSEDESELDGVLHSEVLSPITPDRFLDCTDGIEEEEMK